MLNKNVEAFVMHVTFLSLYLEPTISPARKTQITLLLIKEVTIPNKYSDFSKIFVKRKGFNITGDNWIEPICYILQEGQ